MTNKHIIGMQQKSSQKVRCAFCGKVYFALFTQPLFNGILIYYKCKKCNSILADRKSQEGTKGENGTKANSPSSTSKEVRERSERISDLDKADKLELLRETEPITSYDKEDDDE